MTDEFGREQFRKMIERTLREYYPQDFNRENHDVDQYVELVGKEQLETKYSVYLDDKGQNILTKRNMPWLDIGDLPDTYNVNRQEAYQVFMQPTEVPGVSMIIPYDTWHGHFDMIKAQLNYDQYEFDEREIDYEDIQETIRQATAIVSEFRGVLARRERVKTLVLAVLAAIFLLIAIITGMNNLGYVGPMFIVIFYLVIYYIVNLVLKYKSNYSLRMSQFLLAVLCRAENNRIYLRRGVEVRPGFLGRWLKFEILETEDVNQIVTNIRGRFVRMNLNQKVAKFENELQEDENLKREQEDIYNRIQRNQA